MSRLLWGLALVIPSLIGFPTRADSCDGLSSNWISTIRNIEDRIATTLYNFASDHPEISYNLYLRTQCSRYGLSIVENLKCQTAMGHITSDYFSTPIDRAGHRTRSTAMDLHFGAELAKLLKQPEVIKYLKDLAIYLSDLKAFKKGGNLWQFTLEHTNGNEKRLSRG